MFNFQKFIGNVSAIKKQDEFNDYLKSSFMEIEEYLLNISDEEINKIKFDIEDLLYDLLDNKLIGNKDSKVINAFLILLAEKLIQSSLVGAITIISNYLPNGSIKLRIEAAKQYLKINNIATDYTQRCYVILNLLEEATKLDEYNTNSIKSLLYFYKNALLQFQRVGQAELAKELSHAIVQKREDFEFLQDMVLSDFLDKVTHLNTEDSLALVQQILIDTEYSKKTCTRAQHAVHKEAGFYSEKLNQITNQNFDSIRDVAFKQIKSIGDSPQLYEQLERGEAIISDEALLYKYLVSFGTKHKEKLYSAFDTIATQLKSNTYNLVDWGCGQGLATILLFEYCNERNISLSIKNIILIEPSEIALSRAILHVDILKPKEKINIRAINSDFDCLDIDDLSIDDTSATLHLFSNVLDIENFSLNVEFFKKVSHFIRDKSLFICVSPNRNDKLNNRLDLFYSYFDENFNTTLISSREDSLKNTTRYEKIFEVAFTKPLFEQKKQFQVLQQHSNIDVIGTLRQYADYLVPTLDIDALEQSINRDPEYAIFKIRKIAEIITSKIYDQYEDNGKMISFNDKIRHLSYQKNIFSKDITNYVQTIRTIGNRGVHDATSDMSKLRLDAHLTTMALISFLKELLNKKLIP
ncbi:MAG TPA: DUF4145 domain-containing protein [Bacteroidetes bacterium]|nr:DUF4145 domain-containing protein [Bacteroidota bacterium]